jgi:hypothetical protein
MAIFTKDGKVYTVQCPNPLVKKQVSWEKDKLVFHNFRWDDIRQAFVDQKPSHPKPKPDKKEQHLQETFEGTSEDEKEVDVESVAEEEMEAEPAAEDDRDSDFPHIKYRVLCHCLPARIESIADPLYGDTFTRVKYGSKFVFPCVVISSSDFSLEFWTSDPKEKVSEKSIIYPFSYEVYNSETSSYDKVPYDDYRWWRVSSKEPREGGWSFSAIPSDHQPDFSD